MSVQVNMKVRTKKNHHWINSARQKAAIVLGILFDNIANFQRAGRQKDHQVIGLIIDVFLSILKTFHSTLYILQRMTIKLFLPKHLIEFQV